MTTTSEATTAPAGIRVLLADDEPHLGAILAQFLTARGFVVRAVHDGRAALDALQAEPYDVALLDVVMPELDGLEVLRRLREESTPPEILVITGNGTVETSLAALRLGAYDVLTKPYRMAEIEALIRRAWEKRLLVRENLRLRARLDEQRSTAGEADFITRYAPLQAVLGALAPVRASRSPALLWGEAGVGKRALARWLHAAGDPRAPFIEWTPVDRSAEEIHDSLFGAEATDGSPVVVGALEQAAGGTLLLRAVARLDSAMQDALEGALRRGAFVRRGGTQPIPLEARCIATLMRDPEELVGQGALRASLVDALSATVVALPPLAERRVDVPLLAEHFVSRAAPGKRLTAEAVASLEQHVWPGHVAELHALVSGAARRALSTEIGASDLAISAGASGARVNAAATPAAPTTPGTLGTLGTLAELERRCIADTLQAVGWHQGRAAEALGISPKTLYRKIREYGFTRPSGRSIR